MARHHFFDPTPAELARTTGHRGRARSLAAGSDGFPEDTWVGGPVRDVDDTTFVRDPNSGNARTYPDTNIPIPQLVITVSTRAMSVDQTAADDGARTIWIPRDPPFRYRALCAAMDAAGLPDTLPQIGGLLWIKYRLNPVDAGTPGLSVRYTWEMRYTP